METEQCPMCKATMRPMARQIVVMENKKGNGRIESTGDVTTDGFIFCSKCTYARLIRGGKP